MAEKNYYDILGINQNANEMDIKKAFRKLVRKYHPDVSDHPNADEKIAEINNAYETLSDKEKRAEYDALNTIQGNPFVDGFSHFANNFKDSGFRSSGVDPSTKDGEQGFRWEELKDQFGEGSPFGSGSFRFDDILSAFGRGTRTQNKSHTQQYSQNGQKDSKPQTGFSGFEQFGTGSYTSKGEDQHAEINVDLSSVYTGDTYNIKLNVPYRKSNGNINHEQKTLKIKIPKGIIEGNQIRLPGQGSVSLSGGDNGDLFLKVKLRLPNKIRLDGTDVYQTINITPWEAVLGERITVDTPAGSFDVNIPKGTTSGSNLRLKGKGIPATKAGDLYLVINIITPTASELTNEQKIAYQALKAADIGMNIMR